MFSQDLRSIFFRVVIRPIFSSVPDSDLELTNSKVGSGFMLGLSVLDPDPLSH